MLDKCSSPRGSRGCVNDVLVLLTNPWLGVIDDPAPFKQSKGLSYK